MSSLNFHARNVTVHFLPIDALIYIYYEKNMRFRTSKMLFLLFI